MSLPSIEVYIRDLEAIKYYDEVKRGRSEALEKVKYLQGQLATEALRIITISSENDALQENLSKLEEEVKKLEADSKLKEENIRKMRIRIQELENLKATTEGKTLSEAETAFIQAKEKEIERRANERFNSMKKPKAVRAVDLLGQARALTQQLKPSESQNPDTSQGN